VVGRVLTVEPQT